MYTIIVDMANLRTIQLEVRKPAVENYRLDVYITKRLGTTYSRTLLQKLIKQGLVTVNNKKAKPSYEITLGDVITINLPRLILPQMIAEDIPLDIIYEDDQVILINKPPHFVVHPAAGHWEGTLVNALLHHCKVLPETDDVYRPGIVHRLDKDTSGVILAAKTVTAHANLSAQFEERTIKKEYIAIVEGEVRFDSDVINKPIGRDPEDREKMCITAEESKSAETFYEVLERFKDFTLVKCHPKTGRTHQIRVHLQSIGHPIVADSDYGKRETIYEWQLYAKTKPEGLDTAEPVLVRQALHAYSLCFEHPVTEQRMTFTAELPADMAKLVEYLRKYAKKT